MDPFLFQAFVYLAAAVISVPIAKRLGMGSVLGYLLAGVVVGPFGLHLVGHEHGEVMHFAEFGVVMMLFLIGLELRPALLWRMRTALIGMGGAQVLGTAALIGGLAIALGLPWQQATAIGMILALSSTAIVLQTLGEKGLLKTDGGRSCFAVLLFQDIAVIPMLALLPLLGAGGAESSGHGVMADRPAWVQTLLVLAAVIGVVATGRFLARPVFRFIAQTHLREIFTATALLLVVGITLLMAAVGLSPALGAFLAGVVLAESEYRHELEGDIEPFKGLLLGLFFITVGAGIDFQLLASQPATVAGIVGGLMVLKFATLFAIGSAFKMALSQKLLFSLGLSQGGEFCFVLFSFATKGGILPEELSANLVASVAISMAATPPLFLLHDRIIASRLAKAPQGSREPDKIEEDNPVVLIGFGRFGHMVGRLLMGSGVGVTVLDNDPDQVDFVRKIGLKCYFGDATRLDLLEAAGAQRARLLILCLRSAESTLHIAELAQKHFPHLKILTRAHGRSEAYKFLNTGIEWVFRETLDSSLEMGIEAMRLLGFGGYEARRAARMFRKVDEETVRLMADIPEDGSSYIERARERVAHSAELLRESAKEKGEPAWDVDSLRREVRKKGRLSE